jgi:hypothetical protein
MLDQLLDYSCRELQLSATHHQDAEQHYRAVGDWLAAKDSPLHRLSPIIYPQGSFRIGTTVLPIARNEHDLDFVCEMNIDCARTPAVSALDAVEERLAAHGTYRPMIERMKRCIRLNYAGAFHMDILPAAPAPVRYGTEVQVPDGKLEAWKPSNPKGYAEWFEGRGRLLAEDLIKKSRIEAMPAIQALEEKTPLQRAVQLMKRARDRFFAKDPDAGPRSIVLTTLAGHAYAGQATPAVTLRDILTWMSEQAARFPYGLVVRNPANDQEILSEQWAGKPAAYADFRRWLQWLAAEWNKVLAAGSIPATERQLAALFGDEIVKAALRKHAADTETLRKGGGLSVARNGALGTAGISSVRPNTFYGK